MEIIVINGPNLNMLGKREPEIYGRLTLSEIESLLSSSTGSLGSDVGISFFQSNSEGEIVTAIQNSYCKFDGIIINPGAYTHTSIAIRDAILSTGIPVVEVHISNIYKREDFRQKSFVSGVSLAVVSGFGANSYYLGLAGLVEYLRKEGASSRVSP
ncbi:MAG: type II 3-dehydroquinate dehydratase [Candidatus Dadabacteria bacterium]|nr:type II 3-dehydroquinate dehydratase [Candidatus Dadabacteria bacterium]MCY4263203.1 type II 3-dehydroquinate dehydratase [Candidatus Dadabacteria bacterium]